MNCIDAVEGLAKTMLERFLDVSSEYRMDASEYIRNVKAVIDGVTMFVKSNPEVSETPELIHAVLYDCAKKQWLTRLEKTIDPDQAGETRTDLEYQAYCYDYVYAHGNYPR
jgi:glycine cleavage system H lipoate-binding protein